jgi:hypothetical protein
LPLSRRSRGRIANLPLHQLERDESRLSIRGNPQNRICKEVALQRPKTGKFGYLSVHNHPAHSMAFEFFTDDSDASENSQISCSTIVRAARAAASHPHLASVLLQKPEGEMEGTETAAAAEAP